MTWDVNNFIQQLRQGFGPGQEQTAQEQKMAEAQLKDEAMLSQQEDKKRREEELHQIKMQKEKVGLIQQIIKLFTGGQKKEGGENNATPTQSPTPTPEAIGQFMQALGLGTTWANGDTANPYPDELVPYSNEAGQQYDIDPLILAAQQAQESGGYGYEPRVGASGEQGITQITPKWHYQAAGVGDSNTYASKLANDPRYAIGEQARILSEYLKKQGNMYDALRQYNAGGTLENSGSYADEILKRAGLEQLLPGKNI